MIRFFITIFLLIAFQSVTLFAQPNYKVEYYGALRATIQQADISANADLSYFKERENLYALGAFENLKGEILIMDGKSFSNRALNDEIHFVNQFEERANLLVTAQVESWQAIELSGDIQTMADLQNSIEETANRHGLDMDHPIPFKIEGEFGELNWHVIDWPVDDKEHTHQKHRTSGPNGVLQNQPVNILGFWSDSHHGVFTHHSTNLHMHFVTDDENLAGHVDGLANGRDLTLYLPK